MYRRLYRRLYKRCTDKVYGGEICTCGCARGRRGRGRRYSDTEVI